MTVERTILATAFLAVWSGLIAGVFAAFSEFIMRALGRAPKPAGMLAMQEINRAIIRTSFVFGLIAIAPASIALAVLAPPSRGLASLSVTLAPLVYVPMVLLVTIFRNVPLNNRLDAADAATPEGVRLWRSYVRDWTRLNHVRTIGSLLTSFLYLVATISLAAE